MFKINKLFILFDNNKGKLLLFDDNKFNFIIGANTVGKSILIRLIPILLGSKSKIDFMITENEITENFICGMEFEVNNIHIKTYLTHNKGEEDSFHYSHNEMKFESNRDIYKKFLLEKINYPTLTTWDNNGKIGQPADLLIPIFVDQECWKKETLTCSLGLKYKKFNRIATSLMFYQQSNDFKEMLKKIQDNNELIKKYLENSRKYSGKTRIKQTLKQALQTFSNDDNETYEEQIYIQYLSLKEELQDVKNKIRLIRTKRTKTLNQNKKTTTLLEKLLIKNINLSSEQKKKLEQTISDYMFVSPMINGELLEKLSESKRELIDKIKKMENEYSLELKFNNNSWFPQVVLDKFKEKVNELTTEDLKLSREEQNTIDDIEEKFNDLYFKTKYQFLDLFNKNENIKSFDYINPGGTKGYEKTLDVMLNIYDNFKTEYLILDSIFSEDSGGREGSAAELLEMQHEIITKIIENNRKGIATFVTKNDLLNKINNENINIINMNMEKEAKLSSQQLSKEEQDIISNFI